MNPNHVLTALYGTYRLEFLLCSFLVGKVMVEGVGVFTELERQTAKKLLANDSVKFQPNVEDFLEVVAGVQHDNANVYNECYAALTYTKKEGES